jgi:hypothetical protein
VYSCAASFYQFGYISRVQRKLFHSQLAITPGTLPATHLPTRLNAGLPYSEGLLRRESRGKGVASGSMFIVSQQQVRGSVIADACDGKNRKEGI